MKQDIKLETDFISLDETVITTVITKAVTKLGIWIRKESLKRGKTALNIKNEKRLITRFLKFRKGKGTAIKIWLGSSPIGVDAWGDTDVTDKGVYAAGEFHKSAFVNSHRSGEPLVWVRKNLNDRSSKMIRVTKDISNEVDDVAEQLASEIQGKFNELIEVELNAIL